MISVSSKESFVTYYNQVIQFPWSKSENIMIIKEKQKKKFKKIAGES